MSDLIERLRAADPLPECLPPSIDDVWQRIDAAGDFSQTVNRRSGGRAARRARANRVTESAVIGLTVVIVAAVLAAVLMLGPSDHHAARRPTPFSARDSRHELLRTLAVLRRPANNADRHALRIFGQGGLLPNYLSAQPLPLCGPVCDVKLEPRLARSFLIPGSRYRAAVFPTTTTIKSTRGHVRGAQAVVLSVKGPRMGNASSSAVAASSGTPAASAPVGLGALRRHGVIVSFGVHGSPSINRVVALVPDGVQTVTLRGLTLRSPRSGLRLAHLRSISATVRDNIALFTLSGMASAHLHIAKDPDGPGGGFKVGQGCKLISIVYVVRASAEMTWRYAHADHRSTASFDAYINGRVAPGTQDPSPRCGA